MASLLYHLQTSFSNPMLHFLKYFLILPGGKQHSAFVFLILLHSCAQFLRPSLRCPFFQIPFRNLEKKHGIFSPIPVGPSPASGQKKTETTRVSVLLLAEDMGLEPTGLLF